MTHFMSFVISIQLQVPLCGLENFECVDNVKVDTSSSSCITSCSGLIVTSFYKSNHEKKLDNLFPVIMMPYNKYKKVTEIPHPTGYRFKG